MRFGRWILIGLVFAGVAMVPARAQEKKHSGKDEKNKEKKEETPADDGGTKCLDKTLSEWLKVLRTDKDIKARRKALFALESFDPKRVGVVAGIAEALEKDQEEELRREAADSLGRLWKKEDTGAEVK